VLKWIYYETFKQQTWQPSPSPVKIAVIFLNGMTDGRMLCGDARFVEFWSALI